MLFVDTYLRTTDEATPEDLLFETRLKSITDRHGSNRAANAAVNLLFAAIVARWELGDRGLTPIYATSPNIDLDVAWDLHRQALILASAELALNSIQDGNSIAYVMEETINSLEPDATQRVYTVAMGLCNACMMLLHQLHPDSPDPTPRKHIEDVFERIAAELGIEPPQVL